MKRGNHRSRKALKQDTRRGSPPQCAGSPRRQLAMPALTFQQSMMLVAAAMFGRGRRGG